jgi:uncharacterized protein YndB with AHSA1/START domain
VNSTDSVRATTVVAVEPAVAFAVFTEEIDLWWRRGPRFRWRPDHNGKLRFEGRVGGRLVEVIDDAAGDQFEVGRILTWDPGERLVFEFRALNFEPDQRTEVEVRFEAVPSGTRVSVEHRGWDALPADHAARHGLAGDAFAGMMGVWWADLLVAARHRIGTRAA